MMNMHECMNAQRGISITYFFTFFVNIELKKIEMDPTNQSETYVKWNMEFIGV
jgi:hypothetical protein